MKIPSIPARISLSLHNFVLSSLITLSNATFNVPSNHIDSASMVRAPSEQLNSHVPQLVQFSGCAITNLPSFANRGERSLSPLSSRYCSCQYRSPHRFTPPCSTPNKFSELEQSPNLALTHSCKYYRKRALLQLLEIGFRPFLVHIGESC